MLDIQLWKRSHRKQYNRWPLSDEPLMPLWSYAPQTKNERLSFAVILDDAVVGRITLSRLDAPVQTLGIHMSPLFTGRGYGSTALSLFFDMYSYQFSSFGLYVLPSNVRALRCYHNLDFRPLSIRRWYNVPFSIYRLAYEHLPIACSGFEYGCDELGYWVSTVYMERLRLPSSLSSRSRCQGEPPALNRDLYTHTLLSAGATLDNNSLD